MGKWDMLENLRVFFEDSLLLEEIVRSMDVKEMEEIYEHICRHHDLPTYLDEDEDEE